ncbi:MAG: FAD binding domain-containing protein [Christensenella sp.]|nr:FAD binding domain-containing protein [Christensenella sp.]
MQQLNYLHPNTLEECLAALHRAEGTALPYAGGTDVMIHLRERTEHMRKMRSLVDLSGLPELRGITLGDGMIRLGAMNTHTEVATSPLLKKHAPFLSDAAATVGSLQIRNAGTIGGNVCNGSPAADTVTPLVALDAQAVLACVSGTRTVPVVELYGRAGMALKPDELLLAFLFPSFAAWSTAFLKLGRRKALAISRMNVAAALRLDNGRIQEARISPGCVFRTPDRVRNAEEILIGQSPSKELFAQAGVLAAEEMIRRTGVRWSTEYKQPVLEALVERALLEAAGLRTEA